MNLVELLEKSAQALPVGDYSTGLNAIVRHVKTAIRHLERDPEHDPDSCTDVIYRTNQAYEGSLKEAYRVLAGKDPSGLSPFQIEGFLETENAVRPRVLTQLTRYRQDYRNPSTHDYKLDFDEDEALLAIVSVCAFAKLLINQISSKLASQAAQARLEKSSKPPARASLRSLGHKISQICLSYTEESIEVDIFEYVKGLTESLISSGFDAEDGGFDSDDQTALSIWDIVVRKGRSRFGIDVRPSHDLNGDMMSAGHLAIWLDETSYVGGLLVIRSRENSTYSLLSGEISGKAVYVVCPDVNEQVDHVGKSLINFKKIQKNER